jgi:hypothetical protein
MLSVIVSLAIEADEYIKIYQGSARSVFAKTSEGRSIRFPANILQSFVTRDGVNGTFLIEFDDSNKFQKISRL